MNPSQDKHLIDPVLEVKTQTELKAAPAPIEKPLLLPEVEEIPQAAVNHELRFAYAQRLRRAIGF